MKNKFQAHPIDFWERLDFEITDGKYGEMIERVFRFILLASVMYILIILARYIVGM